MCMAWRFHFPICKYDFKLLIIGHLISSAMNLTNKCLCVAFVDERHEHPRSGEGGRQNVSSMF